MSSISLNDTTGKRLLHVGCVRIDTGAAWRCLKERIAAERGIPEVEQDEAIRIIEGDDDGIEWVYVDGVRVGYCATEIDGHHFGHPEHLTADALDPLPAAHLQAAE